MPDEHRHSSLPDTGFPVVGVVGGGQLARMMQPPAVALGIQLKLLADDADDSAAQVIPHTVLGDYRDLDTLLQFAIGCSVLTFDHEHVPTEHISALVAAGVAVHPGASALVHAQDKRVMRQRLSDLNIPVPRWSSVSTVEEVDDFAKAGGGYPVVLKATRGGYDGKGVWLAATGEQAGQVLSHVEVPGFIVEEVIDFSRELSAVVARSPSGQAVSYPVVETVQVDGICREVYSPAAISSEHAVSAQQIALRLAGELDVTGVMAVEMFDTPEGVLVNELAMRPHNSGHWSIEGAVTSQFENHLRAALDLPLGDPAPVAEHAVMVNVLGGDQSEMYSAYLHCMARDPALKIHMYGKAVKPGRKVGHVTVCGVARDDLIERARHAAAFLRGDISNGSTAIGQQG